MLATKALSQLALYSSLILVDRANSKLNGYERILTGAGDLSAAGNRRNDAGDRIFLQSVVNLSIDCRSDKIQLRRYVQVLAMG